MPTQFINRGNHRSVIFRPISHHSSVVFRHNQSVGHHSDDRFGPFRHDTSVCRMAFNQVINQSVNRLKILKYTHAQASKLSRVAPIRTFTTDSTSRIHRHGTTIEASQPSLLRQSPTPAASRSIPQVVLQPLMGNNRKIKPQGVQRHSNRRKQRLKSTEI
ncbi:Leucine-rich repeat receptor-like protein kinase [Dorcoceras hygrometricum]|uniref:Leucine-rich repeat receptor-like protein kinase n=1 Tax=Dorcoceras hygrometricum TaxID=472368 RepID=A0A2Z7C9T8_9LAMI|nr:Leucine-rich repeat receptor-like protein kinase [Dorcoceras hygrometricum]